jgi:putative restriction endonuclease
MSAKGRDWTREERIVAMRLYCTIPFGKYSKSTKEVIALAKLLNRTPSSIAMKLSNLASLDPAHAQRGVKGLPGASNGDREVWAEFHSDWTSLAALSEQLLADLKANQPQPDVTAAPDSFVLRRTEYSGATEATREVQVRLAQRFFRHTVLANYRMQCCISGIAQKELLIASHIVPWSTNPEHRANPRNGLCLSRLHDGAFDRGLITFDEELRLVLSRDLAAACTNESLRVCFQQHEGRPVTLPGRFHPDPQLLAHHRQRIFRT